MLSLWTYTSLIFLISPKKIKQSALTPEASKGR